MGMGWMDAPLAPLVFYYRGLVTASILPVPRQRGIGGEGKRSASDGEKCGKINWSCHDYLSHTLICLST